MISQPYGTFSNFMGRSSSIGCKAVLKRSACLSSEGESAADDLVCAWSSIIQREHATLPLITLHGLPVADGISSRPIRPLRYGGLQCSLNLPEFIRLAPFQSFLTNGIWFPSPTAVAERNQIWTFFIYGTLTADWAKQFHIEEILGIFKI